MFIEYDPVSPAVGEWFIIPVEELMLKRDELS